MFHIAPAHAAADAVTTEPSAAEQRRAARERTERQMAVLDRLVEIGLEIAEEAGRQAKAPAEEGTGHDPGLTFSRAARAVRLTIALQQRLAEDLDKLVRGEASARRVQIGRLVERAIEADSDGGPRDYRLSAAVWERLTEEEQLDQLAGRPIEEIVARICEDLGLSPDSCAEVMEAWPARATREPSSPLIPAEPGTQVLAAAPPPGQKSLDLRFHGDERMKDVRAAPDG